MIISGDANIFPAEIEALLMECRKLSIVPFSGFRMKNLVKR